MNKSILFFFLLLLSTSLSFARIKVVCDVTYENTGGDWSNFYRTEVEFMAGNELDNTLQSNDLYAVIWFSQTNCAIIKMKHEFLLIREVDKTFVYNYFLSDYLNEGKDGQQINDEYNRKWKIFPKNEVSLLIDPIFEVYPYNAYNLKMKENIELGGSIKRIKPFNKDIGELGIKGVIVKVLNNDYYIVQTVKAFICVRRNDLYYFGGKFEEGDIVYSNFHELGQSLMQNKIKKYTDVQVFIEYIAENYDGCVEWIKKKNTMK